MLCIDFDILDLDLKGDELLFYIYLLKIAKNGSIKLTTKELSDGCGLGYNSVVKAKKALAMGRKELDGKPLIRIYRRQGEKGKMLSDIIKLEKI